MHFVLSSARRPVQQKFLVPTIISTNDETALKFHFKICFVVDWNNFFARTDWQTTIKQKYARAKARSFRLQYLLSYNKDRWWKCNYQTPTLHFIWLFRCDVWCLLNLSIQTGSRLVYIETYNIAQSCNNQQKKTEHTEYSCAKYKKVNNYKFFTKNEQMLDYVQWQAYINQKTSWTAEVSGLRGYKLCFDFLWSQRSHLREFWECHLRDSSEGVIWGSHLKESSEGVIWESHLRKSSEGFLSLWRNELSLGGL